MKKYSSELKELTIDKTAVLVFACNRPESIDRHLKELFERRNASGKINRFPIIVSQDCGHQETSKTIELHSKNLFAFLKVKSNNFNICFIIYLFYLN